MVKVRYVGEQSWRGKGKKTCTWYVFQPGQERWVLMEDAPGFLRRKNVSETRQFETVG